MDPSRDLRRPSSKNKTFRVSVEIAARAEAKAEREVRSLNAVVVELLEAYVGAVPDDSVARVEEVNRRARRRRGRKGLAPATPFTRDELHER